MSEDQTKTTGRPSPGDPYIGQKMICYVAIAVLIGMLAYGLLFAQ